MADTERKFSELSVAGTLTDNDILALSQTDIGTSTLISVKATLIAIATHIAKVAAFTNDLDTTSKTLIGAINELKQLISLIPQFSIDVVQVLPVSDISETTIYLVPSSDPEQGNYYEEYIYVNNTWELVGTTAVDLSAYYTKLEVDGLLAAKANTSDVTAALALKEAKADMDDDVTDIVVGLTDEQTTTAGNPVTLTTEQSGGAKSAVVTFTPVQSGSGDPSPDNVRPISGWDSLVLNVSENLFSNFVQGGINDNHGTEATVYDRIRSGYIKCPKSRFTLTINNAQNNNEIIRSIYFYTENNTYISQETIGSTRAMITTIPSNAEYIRVTLKFLSNTTITPQNETVGVNQLTHTATLGSTYYGGSYDFVSGKLVIDRVIVDLGSLSWDYFSAENQKFFESSEITGMKSMTYYSNLSKFVSDIFVAKNPNVGWDGMSNYNFGVLNKKFRIRWEDYTDATLFKNAINNHYIVYELDTPVSITLTPEDIELLKGLNTVWSDANGTVTVGYSKLPNGNLGAVVDYIKKLEARIAALES